MDKKVVVLRKINGLWQDGLWQDTGIGYGPLKDRSKALLPVAGSFQPLKPVVRVPGSLYRII